MTVSLIADIFQYAMMVLLFWVDGMSASSLIAPDFSDANKALHIGSGKQYLVQPITEASNITKISPSNNN